MPELRFNLPFYPLQGRFSDPSHDYEGLEAELAELAALPPGSLNSQQLYYLFNSFLPAGNFAEMAPYVPHALRLLQDDACPQCVDEGERYQLELLDSLITWCYVERQELQRDTAFRAGMEESFMTLFEHWTSNTRWQCDRHGEPLLVNNALIDCMLSVGDDLAESRAPGEWVFPWLRSERYLARLTALDSAPHAAWALWVSHGESSYLEQRFPLPAATRRRAVEMVEAWLLSAEASPEDTTIWDPILMQHRACLYLFPHDEP